jgi:ABC-type polysaccharide/polyol phosphate transport system ATPase subunit
MNHKISLSVQNLGKRYWKTSSPSFWPSRSRQADSKDSFWALQDLNFEIRRGEGIGIIGHNGAGKSTLLKILGRIISPTIGEARLYGKVNSLLEVGTGFQPDLTGKANIYLNASILGLSRKEVDEQFDTIVEFSGVREFIDMPVRHYSSGMYSRLAFAVAAHITGDILLVDEVLSVGDAEFRRKSLNRMNDLMQAEHRTVLFVSHSMDAILRFCDKVLWMEKGRLLEFGPAEDVVRDYLNKANSGANASILLSGGAVSTPGQEFSQSVSGKTAIAEISKNSAQLASRDSRLDYGYSETHVARIESIALYDAAGTSQFAFYRDESIRVQIGLRINLDERINGFIAIRCAPRKGVAQETLVFSDYSSTIVGKIGEYRLSVLLPSKLFASGTYFLTLGLVSLGSPLIKHHLLKRVVTFQIVDRDEENDVMGEYVRGVIRPSLLWDFE